MYTKFSTRVSILCKFGANTWTCSPPICWKIFQQMIYRLKTWQAIPSKDQVLLYYFFFGGLIIGKVRSLL